MKKQIAFMLLSFYSKFGIRNPQSAVLRRGGFSILELVVSIFLLTLVIGAGLLIIAANQNVMQKSNEMLLASAIAQYEAEWIRNIDFPPILSDRQADYPKKVSDTVSLSSSYNVGSPDTYFKVRMGSVWIGNDGLDNLPDPMTPGDMAKASMIRVRIEISRAKDNFVLIRMPVHVARNGTY